MMWFGEREGRGGGVMVTAEGGFLLDTQSINIYLTLQRSISNTALLHCPALL